jgi:hypothetical protein
MDLVNDLQSLIDKLNISIKSLAENGKALCQAEYEYKILLRQEALKLRQEKGMPVTLISQIIYGVPEVAKKRLDRDIAETYYNTNQEKINALKLQIRVIQSQIEREWNNTNG